VKTTILRWLLMALIGAGGHAMATPIFVGTATKPTGMDGLVVEGTTNDVMFSTTALNSPFSYGTTASRHAAAVVAAVLWSHGATTLENVSPGIGSPLFVLADGTFGANDVAYCSRSAAVPCSSSLWASGRSYAFHLGSYASPGATGEGYVAAANFMPCRNPAHSRCSGLDCWRSRSSYAANGTDRRAPSIQDLASAESSMVIVRPGRRTRGGVTLHPWSTSAVRLDCHECPDARTPPKPDPVVST